MLSVESGYDLILCEISIHVLKYDMLHAAFISNLISQCKCMIILKLRKGYAQWQRRQNEIAHLIIQLKLLLLILFWEIECSPMSECFHCQSPHSVDCNCK